MTVEFAREILNGLQSRGQDGPSIHVLTIFFGLEVGFADATY
jgi:hypothetical protein